MTTAWRIFVHSWRHLTRNAWIGLATIGMFVLVLLSVDVLLSVQALVAQATHDVERRVDVTVTFKPETSDALVQQALSYASGLPQVESTHFISADQALRQFRERHTQDQSVTASLQEIGANPLGPELVIKAKRSEDYPFIMQALQNPQYANLFDASTYDDHRLAIARLKDIADQVRLAGSALIAVFILFGVLLTFNTLRVAVYTQREEIAIMRLVGASSFFIRAPFILEGLWLASAALLVASGLFVLALVWIEPFLRPLFDGGDPGLSVFFTQFAPLILLFEAGGLYAVVGFVSGAAVGKYLHI